MTGGGSEIRTHGGLLTLAGFQDRCLKPLDHSSATLLFLTGAIIGKLTD